MAEPMRPDGVLARRCIHGPQAEDDSQPTRCPVYASFAVDFVRANRMRGEYPHRGGYLWQRLLDSLEHSKHCDEELMPIRVLASGLHSGRGRPLHHASHGPPPPAARWRSTDCMFVELRWSGTAVRRLRVAVNTGPSPQTKRPPGGGLLIFLSCPAVARAWHPALRQAACAGAPCPQREPRSISATRRRRSRGTAPDRP
jgi:hypothetical protein